DDDDDEDNGNGNHRQAGFQKIVELSDMPAIILDQNTPNPFAENTVITFYIPEEISEAKMLFYNSNGIVIKSLEINERGYGKLQVYGENLSSGIYTYSLMADGKLIDSKKMIKSDR
ncbi:MAG: T9SS C-terminal target domain-containing protein, partial [Bacteroidetes bacterium]